MTTTETRPTVLPGNESTPQPPIARDPVLTSSGRPLRARIRIRGVESEDIWTLVGSLAAAISLTWICYERLLPLTGGFGFWLVAYVVFLGVYAGVAAMQWPRQVVIDRLVAVAMSTGAVLVIAAVIFQVVFTAVRGWPAIHHSNFWTSTMSLTGPRSPLTSGGLWHAMVGSLEQLGLATFFSVPLGVTAALFLVEVGGRLARPVRIIVEAMTALPEIIAGLFIYALFILTLGFGQSGLAASLALTVMMIPVVTRTSEVILRLVPHPLREASYALGASQTRTLWNVVLPTARSGLSTAVVLAMARAVGETSPVLLTAGFVNGLVKNPFHGQQTSLPLYIYNYAKFPQAQFVDRAFGAGIALMIMVLVLFTIARMIGGRTPGELSRRQQRRLARAARIAALPPVALGPTPATGAVEPDPYPS